MVVTAGVVATTELLSVGAWLRLPGVLAFWSGAAIVVALWLARQGEWQRLRTRPRRVRRAWAIGRLELIGLAVVLATVLLVGLIAPPGNWESMASGMMRTAMWLQQGSVAAYATPYVAQISQPPLVSYQIAHLMILADGDRFANVSEWLALAGCSLAASLVARELKQGPRVQLLAAVVAATLPMGLLQGSSTQGNLLAAYWVLCFVLLLAQHLRSPARWRLICCGFAGGFALLAASTAFIVLPVAAVVLGLYGGVARRQPRRALLALGAVAAIALAANGAQFARNWQVFGHPVSPIVAKQMNEWFDLTVLTSNLMRNAMLHWSLPNAVFSESVRDAASAALGGMPEPPAATGSRPLEESRLPYRIKETETPNFLHHWLLLISAIGLMAPAVRARGASPQLLNYLLAGWLASIAAFSAVLQWEYWNSRHQTMLFMLGAPLAAVFLGRVLTSRRPPRRLGRSGWRLRAAPLGLLVASAPWLLSKESAPLLPMPIAGSLPTSSIFWRPRAEGYFGHIGGRAMYQNHVELAEQVLALEPAEIGLDIGLPWVQSSYPLVALVRERRKDVQFRYVGINAENPTAALERRGRPFALVKAGGRWAWENFGPWRFHRVWTHPDGTAVLRRWRRPLRVLRAHRLQEQWSRQLEARICEAALGPGGTGVFLQDDLLIYVGVRRPLGAGERPPVVDMWQAPVAGQPLESSQRPLGKLRLLRHYHMPTMWERSNDDGTWSVLANSGRAGVFTPSPADIGARLRATTVSDCGGRLWHNTATPSAPVVPATALAAPRRPARQRNSRQLVVRAEFHAPVGRPENGRPVTRTEIVLHRRQAATLAELDLVAISIDRAHTLRLHVADVGADGHVLWQQSLPIPAPPPHGGE